MAATAGVLNGTDLCIYVGTQKILYSQSCKMSLNGEMRDTSNKDAGGWKKVLPGQKNWSAEISGLVALDSSYNYAYLMSLVLAGTQVALKFKTTNSGDYYYSGNAYLQNVSIDAGNQANVSYSGTFIGDGALSYNASSTPTIIWTQLPPGASILKASTNYELSTDGSESIAVLPSVSEFSGPIVIKNTSTTGLIKLSQTDGLLIDGHANIYIESGDSVTLQNEETAIAATGTFSDVAPA